MTHPSNLVPQASKPRHRKGFAWASVIMTVLALGLALHFAEVETVVARLEGVDLRWLGPAFAVSVLQLGILGLRWSVIAGQLGVGISITQASTEYALSRALNQILPTGIAGDGVRALRHSRSISSENAPKDRVSRVVEALALDRLSGQLGLWSVVLLTSPLASHAGIVNLPSLFAALGALLAVVFLAWAVASRVERARPVLVAIGTMLKRNWRVLCAPRLAIVHLSLSWLLLGTLIVQLYFAGRALGVHLTVVQLLWMGPVMLVASSVPSFFGSWGIREGVTAVLFTSLGLASSTGLAVSVVYGTFDLLVALPGLVVLLFDSQLGREGSQQRWVHTHAGAILVATCVAAWLKIPLLLAVVAGLSFALLIAQGWRRWTPSGTFGAANAVSSLRLLMTLGVIVASVQQPGIWLALAAVTILALDAVDGWVARRSGNSGPFGACFDVEIDALLVMALSVALYSRGIAGAWVLAAGMWRYFFVLVAFLLPTTRRETRRAKLGRIAYVTMVFCFVSALVMPPALGNLLASLGTALISLSFIRSLCELYLPTMNDFRSSPQ